MIRLLRDFRLIPIVLGATACLFVLKLIGLMLDGSYLFGTRGVRGENYISFSLAPNTQELTTQTVTLDNWSPSEKNSKRSWMREMFGFPDAANSADTASSKNDVTITGAVSAPKPAPLQGGQPTDKSVPVPPKPQPMGTVVPLDARQVSQAERAILERLHERRQELDKRARELDMREGMLKEAESKVDVRLKELKAMEAQGLGPDGKKKEEVQNAKFKSLATMYENMKAKDAAKIFDRLDLKVLIDMSSQINPRRMAEIMGLMSPDAAERLTSELAMRANGVEKPANPSDLPKIEGRPNGS